MAAPTPSTMTEPAFATFMQHVLTEILHELKSVRKELHDLRRGPPTPDPSRKRKRPGPTPPCTLCRLSRTPCIATHPNEACSRCISKQVECFDDEAGDPPRVRHPPEDGDDESEPEPEQHGQPQAPIVWQPTYPTGFPPTPVKRDRVPKACAECHARKRKCGPNCATLRMNGASSSRPSPTKPPTPNRGREPCSECRARKRRCIHNPDGTLTPGKTDENDDAPGEDVPVTDTEREPEHPTTSSARHTPSRSHSPPPNGWHYRPAPPPPPPHPWGYEHRPGYPAHGHHGHHGHPHPPFHDRPPYHHPPPPMHPHPHPHPHARLPPAPDMRHPSCKDCHARGVPCTCSPPLTNEQKAATPSAPAGRKGRACLACRKLKMRCVAPNEEGGPDERCQRCERAGLECVYVDRKRRGPGGVGSMGPMDEAARKKLKREGAESEVSVEMTVGGDDAARVLESFADDEDTSVRA